MIGEEEINKIKQETSNIYLSDEDVVSHNQNHRDKFEKRDRFEEDDEDDEEAYDDDELEEMNPNMMAMKTENTKMIMRMKTMRMRMPAMA